MSIGSGRSCLTFVFFTILLNERCWILFHGLPLPAYAWWFCSFRWIELVRIHVLRVFPGLEDPGLLMHRMGLHEDKGGVHFPTGLGGCCKHLPAKTLDTLWLVLECGTTAYDG